MPGLPNRVARRSKSHPAATAFLVVFALALAVALIQGAKPFYWDSGEYWRLSHAFTAPGHLVLPDFEDDGLRGYALPLVLFLWREVLGLFTDNAAFMVMLLYSLLFAAIGALLAPRFARIAWPERTWGATRRVLLGALLVLFWGGFLNYPLSDFPALAAALAALILVTRPQSRLAMLASGLTAGLALVARPAYLLLVPCLVGLAVWDWWEHRGEGEGGGENPRRRALGLALLLLGVVVALIPQGLIHHHESGNLNPLPGGSSLASTQLTQGLKLQRLDGWVGDDRGTSLEYRDPSTAGIVRDLPGGKVTGSGEYAEIALQHPLTIAGVFLRHLVNGLDQRYTTPYVEHLDPPATRRLLRVAGFAIVFLALLRVLWPAARRRLGPARWRYPVALLLITVTSLAGAMETRFLLPIYLLAALLALVPGWPNPIGSREAGLRRYRTLALIAAGAIVYFAIVWAIAGSASDHVYFA
ncbi:MAG TPA: hypothetical protein VEB65_07720 [Solirubrobacterales bacterium]|nr:hypothetical protein [Solirubrobacterales bacterium]